MKENTAIQAELKNNTNSADSRPQPASKSPVKTSKVIKGYTDIQHFYKSSLKYTRPLEKEPNPTYELGYN